MENWIFIVNIKIMKKIRLTEKELTNIIKRVINEDQSQGIVVKTKLGEYIEENKQGLKGEFKIENDNFYIITGGRPTRVIIC